MNGVTQTGRAPAPQAQQDTSAAAQVREGALPIAARFADALEQKVVAGDTWADDSRGKRWMSKISLSPAEVQLMQDREVAAEVNSLATEQLRARVPDQQIYNVVSEYLTGDSIHAKARELSPRDWLNQP